MNTKLAVCVMMTIVPMMSGVASAADPDGKTTVDWTIEACVDGSAVFGKAGACYIVDLKTFRSYTKVKVCGGLAVGVGAGASVNASEVICMTVTVPGTNREAALHSAQEILDNELFWRKLRKEDARAKRLEQALSGRRLSTPNDAKLAQLEDLLETIGNR